ncbi:MAG: peptide ABC transporter substrate-binding protein, partial [Pseudomonadota bacterium]
NLRPFFWSDGEPVTAYDFEFAMRRLMDPTTTGVSYASLLYVVKNAQAVNGGQLSVEELGAKAIDAETFELTLEYPAPYLPELLKHYVAHPVPAHAVREFGDAWTRPENLVVNGPYKLAQWRTGDFLRSVKNPTFYDAENVCFDEIVYYPYSDQDAVIRLAQTGKIDTNNDFPGRRYEELKEILPGWARLHEFLATNYIVFNTRSAPFNDERVRIALSMTLDRQFITEEVMQGSQTPAYAFVPPGIANYENAPQASWKDAPLDERFQMARNLLEEAGYGPDNPLTFEYTFMSTGESPKFAPVVQSNWKDIAEWVDVSIRRVETRVLYNQLQEGDFQVSNAAWAADYNDAQNYLYLLQSTTGPMNYGGFDNPQYDALLEASNLERDMETRAGLLRQAETMILEAGAIAPLSVRASRNLVNPNLTGYEDNIEDVHPSRFICRAG